MKKIKKLNTESDGDETTPIKKIMKLPDIYPKSNKVAIK